MRSTLLQDVSAFATVSLFFLTLQPLRKYAEKKLWVFVGPNSPCRHATITAKNTVFVPQSLPSRLQPGLRGHFFSQLPSPRLRPKKQASNETRFSFDISTARRTIPPTKRELHYPFRTTRRLFAPSRIENRSRQKPHCTAPYDNRKEATKTLYYG